MTKDIKPLNNKGLPHGYHEVYYINDKIYSKGNWKDGKRDGYWEAYFNDGSLMYKGYYKDGKQDGLWEWYNSELEEIEYYIN